MIKTPSIQVTLTEKSRVEDVDFNNLPFGKFFGDHMFVADFINGEWQNLRVQPYGPITMMPATSSLHYGQAIFEGLKAYRSPKDEVLVFRPMANFFRLNRSAHRLCMPVIPEEVFMGGLRTLLDLDRKWVPTQPGSALYIRPFMFATDNFIGVRPSTNYTFIIFTCPVGAYYAEPVRVRVERHYTRATEGGTGFAKCAGNYAGALYPAKLAQEEGYHQLVWMDHKEHKYIEESGTMNVMFMIDDVLITPELGTTVLSGVTRDSVLQLAKTWGIKTQERKITVEEIVDAISNGRLQEAFGVGTAATIAQIALFSADGIDYELPPVENRAFSAKIKTYLDDLRFGRIADKHGWVVKI